MIENRLLDEAITAFGTHGMEGASTRRIAAAANAAMSAITYHYGGKEGLYLAAADRIAERMGDDMERHLSRAAAIADGDAPGARAALKALFAELGDKMMSDRMADVSRFVLREQMNPTSAFDRIYDGFLQGIFECVRRLIVVTTGTDRQTAAITASALVGQAMSPRSSKATLLRQLDRKSFDADIKIAIQHRLAANIDAVLNALAEQPSPTSKD